MTHDSGDYYNVYHGQVNAGAGNLWAIGHLVDPSFREFIRVLLRLSLKKFQTA